MNGLFVSHDPLDTQAAASRINLLKVRIRAPRLPSRFEA